MRQNWEKCCNEQTLLGPHDQLETTHSVRPLWPLSRSNGHLPEGFGWTFFVWCAMPMKAVFGTTAVWPMALDVALCLRTASH